MKSLFIVLSVFILTLIYSSPKAEAACPSGYNTQSFNWTTPSGCVIYVTYCYAITGSGNRHAFIDNIQFDPTSTGCNGLDFQDPTFWEDLRKKIINNVHTVYVPFRPCSEGKEISVLIENASCWAWFETNTSTEMYPTWPLVLSRIYYPCTETATCKNYYSVCRKLDGTLDITLDVSVPSQNANCDSEIQKSLNPNTGFYYSNCFIVSGTQP